MNLKRWLDVPVQVYCTIGALSASDLPVTSARLEE